MHFFKFLSANFTRGIIKNVAPVDIIHLLTCYIIDIILQRYIHVFRIFGCALSCKSEQKVQNRQVTNLTIVLKKTGNKCGNKYLAIHGLYCTVCPVFQAFEYITVVSLQWYFDV